MGRSSGACLPGRSSGGVSAVGRGEIRSCSTRSVIVQTTAKSDYNRGFYMGQSAGSLESARQIVPIVLHLIRPKKVVDVGCGLGTWLSVFAEAGITDYLGVDGSYVPADMLLIPRDRFLAHDLTQPLQLPDRYDLAVSLEVAEHLPASCAEAFVESLTNLAPVVFFSAAVPFQGGTTHVNEQWPEYGWISSAVAVMNPWIASDDESGAMRTSAGGTHRMPCCSCAAIFWRTSPNCEPNRPRPASHWPSYTRHTTCNGPTLGMCRRTGISGWLRGRFWRCLHNWFRWHESV